MKGPESGFERLLEILDSLSIPYMVGGSLAASVHGIPRSTQDVGCVAAVKPEHAGSLVEKLKTEFYVDPRDALRLVLSSTFIRFPKTPISKPRFHAGRWQSWEQVSRARQGSM
jgi:hypothetical protein